MNLAAVVMCLLGSEADELARVTGLVQRRRKLPGSAFSQILVFGWLAHPHAGLEDLADFAYAQGIDVSFQAIDDRINDQAVDFFQRLLCSALEYCCQSTNDVLPVLQRFQGVYVFDTTDVTLPRCMIEEFPSCNPGQAACGILTCLEVSHAGVVDLQVGPALNNDLSYELAHASLPQGSLRLADLGFFNLDLLESYDREGVFYITRYKPHLTLSHCDGDGGNLKLTEYLRQQTGDAIDTWVLVGQKKVKARLVAVRVSEAAARRRRENYTKKKRDKGKATSLDMLEMCGWDVSLTNVPEEKLSWREVVSLRRVRWQVELLFKTWKSVGGLDHLAGRSRERVLVELYAKLLGKVIESWHLLVLCGDPLRFSWYKASKKMHKWWAEVMKRMKDVKELTRWLEKVGRRLHKTTKKERRKKRPLAWQTVLGTDDPAWADGSAFADPPPPPPPWWFANRDPDLEAEAASHGPGQSAA
jgi:hypothetical protein